MIDYLATLPHYAEHLAPIRAETGGDTFDGDTSRLADNGEPVVIAGWHDLTVVPASRRVALVDHGAGQTYIGQDHGAYAGGKDRERIGLYLTPSERVSRLNRDRYPDARVETVGAPRLDRWYGVERPANPVPVVAFVWHWSPNGVPEQRSAWRFYREVIGRLVSRRSDLRFVGHGHPRSRDTLDEWYGEIGVETVGSLDAVLAVADLVVFDNTSAGYEAAAVGIPVLALDSPEYRPEVDHGLRFWDLVPGLRLMARMDGRPNDGIVHARWGPDAIGDAIDEAIDDRPELAERRRETLGEVYWRLDGHAAARSAEILADWVR